LFKSTASIPTSCSPLKEKDERGDINSIHNEDPLVRSLNRVSTLNTEFLSIHQSMKDKKFEVHSMLQEIGDAQVYY